MHSTIRSLFFGRIICSKADIDLCLLIFEGVKIHTSHTDSSVIYDIDYSLVLFVVPLKSQHGVAFSGAFFI